MTNTAKDNYFLPESYTPRDVRTTIDEVSGQAYWTPKRLKITDFYQYPVYQYVGDLVEKRGAKVLADIGCGPATKLRPIHERHPALKIYGVDQPDAIAFCQKAHNFGEWFSDDFENPSSDVPDFKADIIVSADVIEHLLNPDLLLEYIKLKLAADGVIVISTPDRDALYGEGKLESGNKDHVREWNCAEFKAYLEDRGFEVLNQFMTFPGKPGLSKPAIRHALRQILNGNKCNYNQVCLIKPK